MDILIALVGFVIGLAVMVYVLRPIGIASGDEIDWGKVGLFFGVMLLGVFSREAYNVLVSTSNASFNWTSVAIAGLVSPMLFGLFFTGQNEELELTIPNLVLAYQNGFFWNSILETIGS